jgi:hypothetical protein
MSESPKGFERFASAEEAEAKHFSDAKNMRQNYPEAAAWKFVSFWEWIHQDYDKRILPTKQVIGKMQTELLQNQTKFEKLLGAHYNSKSKEITNRSKLEKALNSYTASWYDRYFKALEKIRKIQK